MSEAGFSPGCFIGEILFKKANQPNLGGTTDATAFVPIGTDAVFLLPMRKSKKGTSDETKGPT